MANKVHEAFLKLVGFEDAEIPEYLPEWRNASEKLGLRDEDVAFALQEWIPAHFEVQLQGVRKLLGCLIKEVVDLTKANAYKQAGTKIVYGIMPAITHYYYALKLTAGEKVYVSFPDYFLTVVLNALFHRLNPYLEEAEKTGVPYGCRHCALNKTRYAARRLGIIPSPDVNWIWGFVCDEGPKTDEFIQLYHDPTWETYITRIPHDQPLGTVEDEVVERVEYLASQMRDGFQFVQDVAGFQVPEGKIAAVTKSWQRYYNKLAELYRLLASDPQPLSGQIGGLFFMPLTAPFNTGLEPMERALDTTIEEVKQRVARKEGIMPEGAPKLMAFIMPVTLPWIPKMFENNGVGLTFGDIYLPSKKQLMPPRYDDPFMAAAETWLKRSSSINTGYRAQLIREKMETYGIDGLVLGFFDFDRWIGSDHRLLARMVEEQTSKPVFYIEGDIWDDRDYSPEALRTRIESICEIVKMRKD